MEQIDLSIGAEVFHGNSRYRVVATVDLEHICVRSSSTGSSKKLHISEVSSQPQDPNKPVEIIPSADLLSIPDQEWQSAHNKALRFNQILQIPYENRRQAIRDAAEEFGISEPSIYRQLQTYKKTGGDPLSLLRKKRIDKGRFEPEVEQLIQSAITKYLSTDKLKVVNVYRDLELNRLF